MDTPGRLRLSHLRAMLVAGRLEKSALANEIAASDTPPGRKKQAVHRYFNLTKELQITARELEIFLTATRTAPPKHIH